MGIMIPYLGPITRLALEPKGAFYIAGVKQGASTDKVALDERKKRELEKKQKLSLINENTDNSGIKKDEDGTPHLDTWA